MLHYKFGYCSRILSFIAVVASLPLFHFDVNREHRHIFLHDKVFTCILLFGAIALDVIQFLRLVLSDWTIAMLGPLFDESAKHKSWRHKFVHWILIVKYSGDMFLD